MDRGKKGMAKDRLKTPEEIAQEEKQKLQQLETARIARMKGEDIEDTNNRVKNMMWSADDLDDGLVTIFNIYIIIIKIIQLKNFIKSVFNN